MRIMDFGNDLIVGCAGQADTTNTHWLALQIWAYVAWPDDAEMRLRFLAAQAAYQIAQLTRPLPMPLRMQH